MANSIQWGGPMGITIADPGSNNDRWNVPLDGGQSHGYVGGESFGGQDQINAGVPRNAPPQNVINSGSSTASRNGGGGGGGGSGGGGSYSNSSLMQSQFDAYNKYRPQMAQTEFDLYSKYAPQYMKVQDQALKELYPNQSGLGEMLAKDVSGRLSSGDFYNIPEPMRQAYQEARAGADTQRGLYRSGMSGARESRDLTELGMDLRERDTQTALSLYGGIPKATVPGSIPGDVGSVTGTYSDNLSAQTSMYGQNLQAQSQKFSDLLDAQISREKFQNNLSLNSGSNSSRQSNPWGQWAGNTVGNLATTWGISKWLDL
jgi:hypothetical protein